MIRVALLDDHVLVRSGLRQILEQSGLVEVCGEAGSYHELVSFLHSFQVDDDGKVEGFPQVLVMDISLPGKNGLEALSDLHLEFPDLPVLMLSTHPADQYAIRTFKTGASGYLNKGCAAHDLVTAIQTLFRGEKYITPETAELLASHVQTKSSDQPPHTLLSDREFQVFMLIGKGVPLTEIAKMLSISIKTISTYRIRTLKKMGLTTNAEVAVYIAKNGLEA
jgi:two-component system invasion response regulator UvrY